jgi:hypothetical protein
MCSVVIRPTAWLHLAELELYDIGGTRIPAATVAMVLSSTSPRQ